MENASRALLFAAEVLIGVVVLSIGVALFMMFQGYSQNTAEQLSDAKLVEFNSNFTKFYGNTGVDEHGRDIPIKVSAHEIISTANFAFQNNLKYDLVSIEPDNSYKLDPEVKNNIKGTLYVKVNVKVGNSTIDNIENWNESQKNKFLLDNALDDTNTNQKYFKCSECKINPDSGRVYEVTFELIK